MLIPTLAVVRTLELLDFELWLCGPCAKSRHLFRLLEVAADTTTGGGHQTLGSEPPGELQAELSGSIPWFCGWGTALRPCAWPMVGTNERGWFSGSSHATLTLKVFRAGVPARQVLAPQPGGPALLTGAQAAAAKMPLASIDKCRF